MPTFNILKNIWMILTLDCQGSAELTSDSFDRNLSFAEKIAVKMHCFICSKSRKLNRQMNLMNSRLDEVLNSTENQMPTGLSDDARKRIAEKISDV